MSLGPKKYISNAADVAAAACGVDDVRLLKRRPMEQWSAPTSARKVNAQRMSLEVKSGNGNGSAVRRKLIGWMATATAQKRR